MRSFHRGFESPHLVRLLSSQLRAAGPSFVESLRRGAPVAPPPLRVLLVALELLGPCFSGNGQYARCIVRGLVRAGARVLIVSGRPADAPMEAQDAEMRAHASDDAHGIIDVPLSSWGRLDSRGPWRDLVAGCDAPAVAARVAAFAPDVACAVDFHAVPAWAAIRARLAASGPPPPPLVWLNFRVYSASTSMHADASDAAFYSHAEADALAAADLSVALCRSDALHLLALSAGVDPAGNTLRVSGEGADATNSDAASPPLPRVSILLPPLRGDIAALVDHVPPPSGDALESSGSAAAAGDAAFTTLVPSLVTSLIRLSPEKHAACVPTLLEALDAASPGALRSQRLTPFMAGAAGESDYARTVRERVTALEGAVVTTAFLGPADLARVLRAGALNLHPARVEAYGMTIVEAAALGVPSLVHVPGWRARAGGMVPSSSASTLRNRAARLFHPRTRGVLGAMDVSLDADGALRE